MIYYDKTLQVTETEFNTCQEDIKTAIRKIVDRYQTKLLNTFPTTRVDFVIPMKGNKLKETYKFNYIQILKDKTEKVYAELTVHIKVIKEENEEN